MSVKSVSDLGIAAYVLMHGFRVLGKKDKSIQFEVSDEDLKQFESNCLDYLSSEFHRFDSCLMALKKLNETKGSIPPSKSISDLGTASYILMHGFKVLGRKGKFVYFEVANDKESINIEDLSLKYITSDYHRFDSCLMSLKKLS